MKTLRQFAIVTAAIALSLYVSRKFVSVASSRDDFKINRFEVKGKPLTVNAENVLMESLKPLGEIVGSFKAAPRLSTEDSVYVKFKNGAVSVGDRFLVYRNEGGVRVPGTFFSRVGQHIEYRGTLQITSVLPETVVGRIVESWSEIQVGDELAPFESVAVSISPQEPVADVRGMILGSPKDSELIGAYEFAFINRGSSSGLRLNDKLWVIVTGDGSKEIKPGLPENAIAELVVVNVQADFATTYVLSSLDSFGAGHTFKSARNPVRFLDDPASVPLGESTSAPRPQ